MGRHRQPLTKLATRLATSARKRKWPLVILVEQGEPLELCWSEPSTQALLDRCDERVAGVFDSAAKVDDVRHALAAFPEVK